MTRIVERTILFIDLRGSTSLFETLGNAEATSVVTHCVGALARVVTNCGGRVVKTLGDGLLAMFDGPTPAVQSAILMHDVLEGIVARGHTRNPSPALRALRAQVAIARGEIVEIGDDCFGDAVNVAARLLDHASDNETLITVEVLDGLAPELRGRFRSLDRISLRGRAEPVEVHVLGGRRGGDTAITQFGGELEPQAEPEVLRLRWLQTDRLFGGAQMPVVLGRSPQATFCVDDSRVSRSHARIDWHGGSFQLSDLSYNGSYVRFKDGEVVSLRRGSCALHGSGSIGLGGSPTDPSSPVVLFEVNRSGEVLPASSAAHPPSPRD